MNQFQNVSKICIISDKPPTYSETFIKAHIDRLPAKTIFLYGEKFPVHRVSGQAIVPNSIYHRAIRRISRKVLQLSASISDQTALKKFFREEQVDAVLAEYGSTGIAVKDVCQAIDIPLIVHFHGYDAYSKQVIRKLGNKYIQLFKKASAIITVSKNMEKQVFKLGAPLEKIYYNPYGVDLSKFRLTNPSNNSIKFLAVGRFTDKKAPHLTIKAFKQVIQQVPEAQLEMVGNGTLLTKCQQLVESLNISNNVTFLGACSHEEVIHAMQRARAFVQHSVQASNGDCEGTPVAILEAQASGLPIIATRHAGITDIVLEEKTGLLCNEGDTNKMAEHMIRIAKNPQLAFQLGNEGRSQIINNFSMEVRLTNLMQIINHVTSVKQ